MWYKHKFYFYLLIISLKKEAIINDSMIFLCREIETTKGIIIGGFLKRKITRTLSRIGDENCFLFTNRNNQLKKYDIKKEKKWESFQVYPKSDKYLFIFGNDLFGYKQNVNEHSLIQERNAFFQYGRERNVLLGSIGEFSIERLYVIQMN